MNDDPLFESRNGAWCYKGLPTDSKEDHAEKCPACNACQEIAGKDYSQQVALGQVGSQQVDLDCSERSARINSYL